MGTYELGFEGCIEVHHQVERYNPKGTVVWESGKRKCTSMIDLIYLENSKAFAVPNNKFFLKKASGEEE